MEKGAWREIIFPVLLLYNRLGNYPMAESYFKKAIALNPSDKKYYFYIGVVYEKMKQYDKSISAMKSVLAIDQNHSNALNYLGYIYADQGKNLDEAEKFLVKALKIDPNNGYFIDSLGWIYYRKHDYKKALKLLLEAVRKIPPDPTVLEHLGDVYANLGADASAQLAQASADGHSRSGFYIASIFERIGLIDEAVGTWDRLGKGKQGPEARDIHLKIAELRERQGKIQESLDHALMATRIDPKDPELLYFDGLLYNRLGNYPMAESYFKKAIALNPSDKKYYFYIGVVYEKMKQYDKSISAMKSVLAIDQNHSNALNYLGYIYADQGKNLDEAEKFLVKALKIDPNNGYFIDSLGWIYYRKHDYKKALKLLLEAVRKIPPDPTVLEHLGDVYANLGADASAMDAYKRALKAKVDGDRDIDRSAMRKKLSVLQKKIKEGLEK